jgi:gliding motility-associated-like protein
VQNEVICHGDSFTFGGTAYTTTGNYPFTFQTINGCDSTVTLNLTVNPVYTQNIQADICQGDSYNFMGQTFNQTGVYPIVLNTVAGCDSIITINLTVHNPQALFNAAPPVGCAPLSVNFTNISVPSGMTATWDLGNGTTASGDFVSTVYTLAGSYSITMTVTDAFGCIGQSTATNLIIVGEAPVAGFTGWTTEIWLDEPQINIADASTGATNWYYTVSDGNQYTVPDFNHTFTEAGQYTITQVVSNSLGCYDTASALMDVKPVSTFFVPNTFTPNDDDRNPIFRAFGQNITEFELMIFNRWGELIYSTKDIETGWDGTYNGKECQQDQYVYKIRYKNHRKRSLELLGSVILVR